MKLFATNLIIFFISQNIFAQNTPPPDMPIPPEFSQPAPPQQQGNMPPQQQPQQGFPPPQGNVQPQPQQQPPQQMQPPSPAQPQAIELNATPTPEVKPKMPDDFELIEIRPYYKNKPRLGKLTATLTSSQNDTLATVSGDFGDCKKCIRGASLKGKLGIRLYGSTVKDLTVSRKQSTSIKLVNCPTNNGALVNNTYVCEFSHKDATMKLTLKLEP